MAAISFFFFSSRRRHTRSLCDWSSDVCSSDLADIQSAAGGRPSRARGGRRPLPDKAFFAARTADCRRAGGRHAVSQPAPPAADAQALLFARDVARLNRLRRAYERLVPARLDPEAPGIGDALVRESTALFTDLRH